jgi:hypothetical protein
MAASGSDVRYDGLDRHLADGDGKHGMNFMGLQTWEAGHVFRKWELADIKLYSYGYYIVIY